MSALRAAERYVRHGFAVVPVPHGKKSPVLKGWEGLRLTSEELSQHPEAVSSRALAGMLFEQCYVAHPPQVFEVRAALGALTVERACDARV